MNTADRQRSTGRLTPTVLRAGDEAVLLECAGLEETLEVFQRLSVARQLNELNVNDLIPAARTVLIRGGEACEATRLITRIPDLLARSGGMLGSGTPNTPVVIPVVYDGPDLDEVATFSGLSPEEVIRMHSRGTYRVAFNGFSPGFAYLLGGDPRLHVPRRADPRPRVPAMSLGLAGPFSGIYPNESPGGWQLIGRASARMWDPLSDNPALLEPGMEVRFERARAQAVIRERSGDQRPNRESSDSRDIPALRVTQPAIHTLIEDAGRIGLVHLGVNTSGAADRGALARANALVGNAPDAPAIEMGPGTFVADVLEATTIALAGAERTGIISGARGDRPVPPLERVELEHGERIVLGSPSRGLRTVMALRGGVAARREAGSASRDTLAAIGPAPIRGGEVIARGNDVVAGASADPSLSQPVLPAPGEVTHLTLLLGPRSDWFEPDSLETLTRAEWTVSVQSDRVGIRLHGPELARRPQWRGAELLSEGMPHGAVQVPPSGQPILFLADQPLTGGYPVIAVLRREDRDTAAQLPPNARVRFSLV